MRDAQKPAVKALFAALESAREAVERGRTATVKFPPEPPEGRAIEIDLVWLSMRGIKGRA